MPFQAKNGWNLGLTGRIAAAVADVRLDDVLTESTGRLSEGYKRRDVSVQALLNDLPALVLDEPKNGFDPNRQDQVRFLFKNIVSNKAIILSTHILDDVEAECSGAIIIDRGKIVVDSDPNTLATRSHKLISVHRKLS